MPAVSFEVVLAGYLVLFAAVMALLEYHRRRDTDAEGVES